MLDAVVGAVIMVVATSSLLYSIEVAERAFDQAGKYSLNEDERELLQSVGMISDADQKKFWVENISVAPEKWLTDE